MIHNMYNSQTLAPVTRYLTNELMKTYGTRDRGYSWAQQHKFPLTKTDLPIATAKCPVGQQYRPTLNLQNGIIHWGGGESASHLEAD